MQTLPLALDFPAGVPLGETSKAVWAVNFAFDAVEIAFQRMRGQILPVISIVSTI